MSGELAGGREEAGAEPARAAGGTGKWLVLLSIGVGTFMSALDGSVVNTVLPIIERSFASDVATVEWVVTVYLLVVSGLLLSFGRAGDLYGHKPIYLAGFGIFVISSALCGFAPTDVTLILFRSIQAIGAAMLFANSPAILTGNFPAEQRGQALGLQATMTYLGLTAGPSLGGWLAHAWSWRAVFFINVPVGILAAALGYVFIQRERPAQGAEPFDLLGAFLFLVGLVALLLGLNQGEAWGWTSAPVLGLIIGSVLILAVFLIVEARMAHPMLDLSLFGNRIFSAATASAVLNYICLYTILFLLPFYLIQGRGMTSEHAGLLLTAQPVLMAITAPISGTLSDRIGSRLPGTLGMAILAAGLYLLSTLGPHSGQMQIILYLAIVGLGTGLFISPNNSALMGSAPRQRQGIAAGILASARNVGMALGVGLSGAIFTTVLAHAHVPGVAPLFPAFRTSLLAAAGVAVLGAITSAVRGGKPRQSEPGPQG